MQAAWSPISTFSGQVFEILFCLEANLWDLSGVIDAVAAAVVFVVAADFSHVVAAAADAFAVVAVEEPHSEAFSVYLSFVVALLHEQHFHSAAMWH